MPKVGIYARGEAGLWGRRPAAEYAPLLRAPARRLPRLEHDAKGPEFVPAIGQSLKDTAEDEPTANLLLAKAHLAGVEIVSLGPSTGRLDL